MKHFNLLFSLALLFLISACATKSNPDATREEWIDLFNNKDLTGWDIKIAKHDLNDNFNNTFYVKDSILEIDYSRYDKFDGEFGHLYYNQPFSYYRIRLEYRFRRKQLRGGPDYAYLNSGVMLHSQAASTLTKNQTFPVSLEMQFLASNDSVKRTTGNLCTPGTEVFQKGSLFPGHCIDSNSRNYDENEWVTIEAVVLGDSIVHHILGKDTVLTYEHPRVGGGFVGGYMIWTRGGFADSLQWMDKQGTPLKEGYIALQAESHPLEFRKVQLMNLKGCTDPKALNYKSYFIKSDNTQCRYK